MSADAVLARSATAKSQTADGRAPDASVRRKFWSRSLTSSWAEVSATR